MKNLGNLKLNSREVKRLLTKQYFSCGSEAVICRSEKPNTLYKIFTQSQLRVGTMSLNKLKKLTAIYNMNLENCTLPLRTLSNNGNLIGYEMTYNPNNVRLKPNDFSKEELLDYLQSIKEILCNFTAKGIIYGDVSFQNILIDRKNHKVSFCDMDNIQIGKYPIDFLCHSLTDYYDIRGIDEKTDAYMHNLLVLKSLGLDFFYCDTLDIMEEFTQEAVKTFTSMQELETFTGEYIIKYLRK